DERDPGLGVVVEWLEGWHERLQDAQLPRVAAHAIDAIDVALGDEEPGASALNRAAAGEVRLRQLRHRAGAAGCVVAVPAARRDGDADGAAILIRAARAGHID